MSFLPFMAFWAFPLCRHLPNMALRDPPHVLLSFCWNPPFSKSLPQCSSLALFSSTCYIHLSLPFYWVSVTMELSALSSFTTEAPLVCQEDSFTILGPRHVESDASPMWYGTFLTSLPVCLGTTWIEIFVTMKLTHSVPSWLLSEVPTKFHNCSSCSWVCNPFFALLPSVLSALSFLMPSWSCTLQAFLPQQ